ncbi:hypothetical protein HK102_011038 [Quaeritorhiza haematococci]|nr:hypothetical protein HK102_011038 [Quaeritorhiza haematococci]
MLAVVWRGSADVRVENVLKPMITDPKDAIVRITSTSICGSDLHLYHKEIMGMQKGDILGHEFMGVIEEVGPEVQNLKRGQRVVCCFDISCGACDYCKRQEFSLCDTTNDSAVMEKMYGFRCSGIYGYSHLTGGYPGGQAEYVRVPFADNGCLPVPDGIPDEKVLFLSDILCTAWHANELGAVSEGDRVAIWGAGPVGLLAAMLARNVRKASQVVVIDDVPSRLQKAREIGHDVITINFNDHDVLATLKHIMPGGPDVVIDAAGFRYAKSTLQRVQRATMVQTDSSDVLTEAIIAVRKAGRVSVVADYIGYTNQFPIGPLMEKGLTMRAGQTPVQKYWKHLLNLIQDGTIDPTFIITHRMPLEQAPQAYNIFDRKEEGCIKVVLSTPRTRIEEEEKAMARARKREEGVEVGGKQKEAKEQERTAAGTTTTSTTSVGLGTPGKGAGSWAEAAKAGAGAGATPASPEEAKHIAEAQRAAELLQQMKLGK